MNVMDKIISDKKNSALNYCLGLSDLNLSEKLYLYVLTEGDPELVNLFNDIQTIRNKNAADNKFERWLDYTCLMKPYIAFAMPIMDLIKKYGKPDIYISIMHALANGGTNSADISVITGVKSGTLSKYLGQLRNDGYIDYITPLGGGKRGKFVIVRPYYHFWFRFIYKNVYKERNIDLAKQAIRENIDTYLKETVLSKYLMRLLCTHMTGTNMTTGEWWNDDIHIDAICIDSTNQILYISKFYNRIVNSDDYHMLQSFIRKIKEYKNWNYKYYLYSSQGFDDTLKNIKQQNLFIEDIILKPIYNPMVLKARTK